MLTRFRMTSFKTIPGAIIKGLGLESNVGDHADGEPLWKAPMPGTYASCEELKHLQHRGAPASRSESV